MKHNDNKHSSQSPQFSADDPRLTAYALGEMDAAERAAFETEINLRNNPAAQAALAEIRSLSGELETAFAAEPAPEIAPLAMPAQEQEQDWRAAREAEAQAARERDHVRERKPFRFPYFLVAGLATACFALLFFTVIKPDFEKNELKKKQTALAAAAASGTVVIDGRTYVAIDPQMQTGAATAPLAIASSTTTPTTIGNNIASNNTRPPAPLIAGYADKLLPVTIGTDGKEIVHMEKYIVTADPLQTSYGSLETTAATRFNTYLANGGGNFFVGDSGGYVGGNNVNIGTRSSPSNGLQIGSNASGYMDIDASKVGVVYAANSTGNGGTLVTGKIASWSANAQSVPETESYTAINENTFQRVTENPLSTFSADIDTASYTNVRRILNASRLPPPDAVRIEEMVNYFTYNYAPPAKDNAAPFAATMEVAAAPWNPEHRLVRIGIKGREIDDATRPAASLVFLIDVSGSMDEPNKLPLVKESMRMLVNRLRPDDRIAIVTYANGVNIPLTSTPVSDKTKILAALDDLRASGGTNGGQGIQLAYEIAKANFLKDGANRVILCTDGDFNIGIRNRTELTGLIEEKAKSGVFLTVLGFGMGNLKDSTLQLLADKGNGNHGYIDNRDEARRLLVEQTAGTLVTIAKDMKLQVEFNPAQVDSYRLIGYEKRLLAKEDFNNDKVDAGEIGAGHTVTALYEVVPVKTASVASGNSEPQSGRSGTPAVDTLKYQTQTVVTNTPKLELKGELLTLKIRYKAPASDMSDKVEFVLEDKGTAFAEASPDFKFTCSVAAFGMILRNSPDKGVATYDGVLGWAEAGAALATSTEHDRRVEFTDLVRRAKQLAPN